MRYSKKEVRYIPGLKNYGLNKNKSNSSRNLYGYNFQRTYRKNLSRNNLSLIIIGVILISIGIVNIFKNTIVYSPFRFMYSSGAGVSFGTTSMLLFLGIIFLFLRRKSIIGVVLIGCGIIIMIVAIFLSLKMSFLPLSLIKAILIFGCVFVGFTLIVKSIFRYLR